MHAGAAGTPLLRADVFRVWGLGKLPPESSASHGPQELTQCQHNLTTASIIYTQRQSQQYLITRLSMMALCIKTAASAHACWAAVSGYPAPNQATLCLIRPPVPDQAPLCLICMYGAWCMRNSRTFGHSVIANY